MKSFLRFGLIYDLWNCGIVLGRCNDDFLIVVAAACGNTLTSFTLVGENDITVAGYSTMMEQFAALEELHLINNFWKMGVVGAKKNGMSAAEVRGMYESIVTKLCQAVFVTNASLRVLELVSTKYQVFTEPEWFERMIKSMTSVERWSLGFQEPLLMSSTLHVDGEVILPMEHTIVFAILQALAQHVWKERVESVTIWNGVGENAKYDNAANWFDFEGFRKMTILEVPKRSLSEENIRSIYANCKNTLRIFSH
jgi:hypothetical protein